MLHLALALALPAFAQGTTEENPLPEFTWTEGPQTLDLGHDLTLQLPIGNVALLHADAQKLMESLGNTHDDALLALVAKDDPESDWLLSIDFEAEGYVKDDDANDLDAEALLQSYKDGTEAANKEREARGFPAIHVTGWSEQPAYDAATHHLKWGLTGTASDGDSVNYFTRVLGRRGFASLQLMASPEGIGTAKVDLQPILASLAFNPGAKYEDFDASTDKAAEYGLAALVLGGAGVAAGKAGLFAKLFAILLAGKKFVIAALVGVGALVKRLFGGNVPPPRPPRTGTAPKA
jgi:uncharacterized membrane-anchored protein